MGTTTLLSFEEFLNLPNLDAGKRELLEGELIELPPATGPHNRIANRIVFALKNFMMKQADDPDRACVELGFEISAQKRSWLQPDAALLHSGQRLNRASYYEGAPLIAIEVISPRNKARDIDRKRLIYLAHGSEEVWIVQPRTRTITVESGHKTGSVRYEHAIVSALLPGFHLNLDDLFAR